MMDFFFLTIEIISLHFIFKTTTFLSFLMSECLIQVINKFLSIEGVWQDCVNISLVLKSLHFH